LAEYVVEFGKDGQPVESDGRLMRPHFTQSSTIWAVLERFLDGQSVTGSKPQRHRAACRGFRQPKPRDYVVASDPHTKRI